MALGTTTYAKLYYGYTISCINKLYCGHKSTNNILEMQPLARLFLNVIRWCSCIKDSDALYCFILYKRKGACLTVRPPSNNTKILI